MLRKWIVRALNLNRPPVWHNDVNLFFVLGMGRSGTNFLADVLNKCPGTLVHHEPFQEDFQALVDAHGSHKRAMRYMRDFRLDKMHELIRQGGVRTYGEVNSNLRFHAKEIMAFLPKARLLHLVRDGRDVVRSVMERKHYTPGSIGHHDLHPLPTDPLHDKWNQLSRFEKVCWLWADANRRLAEDLTCQIRFEDLVSDYDYFQKNLLQQIGLQMDKSLWEGSVNAPINTTKKFSYPHWREWDVSQRAAFDAICGEQMVMYGYK